MKRANNLYILILAALALMYPAVLFAADLTAQTLESDIAYYRKSVQNNNLTLNDRRYVLTRIEEKYRDSGVDLAPLRSEVDKLDAVAVTAVASPAAPVTTPRPAEQRTKAAKAPSRAADNVNPEKYSIEAGDVLGISASPADELSRELVVQADGKISFPLIGAVQATGLTPAQLSSQLERSFSRFISSPKMSVSVKRFSRRQVFVTGEARKVGAFDYKENLRLLEFISSLGGFTESANRREVKIYRGPATQRRTHTVNVDEIISSGDFSNDFLLEAGDIVEISKSGRIAILGDVNDPGYYDYHDNLRLLELISLAGGFKDTAELGKVNVIHPAEAGRDQSITKVNLKKILSGRQKDITIASGDTVYVPKKPIASANWFVSNILPWLSLVSLGIVISAGI